MTILEVLLCLLSILVAIPAACRISNKIHDKKYKEFIDKRSADRKRANIKVYYKKDQIFAEVFGELYIQQITSTGRSEWGKVANGETQHSQWTSYLGLNETAYNIKKEMEQQKRALTYQKLAQETGIYR